MNEDLSPEQREALEKISDDVTRARCGLMSAAVAWVEVRLDITRRYKALRIDLGGGASSPRKEPPKGNTPPPGGLGPS